MLCKATKLEVCGKNNMRYDIVIIGGGHAGVEAALASARLGLNTLLLTLSIDGIALMPCNPSIGGTGKGHLVREIDALGGQMGLSADAVSIQSRMLNSGKGPAVHSLRAQEDKRMYQHTMLNLLFATKNLSIWQAEAAEILTKNGKVCGVKVASGDVVECRAAVICSGVYLNSRVLIGSYVRECGPQGLENSKALTKNLIDLGFGVRRFKTGTPARIDARSMDFDEMQPQEGDKDTVPFSFMTDKKPENKAMCYLTYTNEQTHKIILDNIHLSPMYSGLIHATGTRYCPSIEDKIVRFADKDKHQLFMEPEGIDYPEWYAQGFSSSLPEWVQREMYHTVPGLRHAVITRPAYAIEYDCIDPLDLNMSLGYSRLDGLYTAGQLNGSSGYEEAAAQGLIAGINAALYVKEQEPFVLTRDSSYIGVLIDDLTTKGTNEPYRMMTGRVEHRLSLRQDNADIRLTERGYKIGLASEERMRRLDKKLKEINELNSLLDSSRVKLPGDENTPNTPSFKPAALLRRSDIPYEAVASQIPDFDKFSEGAKEQVLLNIRYEGYLKRESEQIERMSDMEQKKLSPDIDYMHIDGLRLEARQKLSNLKPYSLGQASRISGVSPADIAVLMVWLKRGNK